ncbi:hypothetical protein Tco_0097389 [Tanacetum coccineum]
MAAPTSPISADSAQGSFGDMIDIGVDIIHPEPVAVVSFPVTAVVDIAEVENASLRAKIKTMEAVEKVTRNHKRLARIGIEQQLVVVQESHRQYREEFRKLKELVTSQFGQRS